MNTEQALKQQKQDHKRLKFLKAIYDGKLSRKNTPKDIGWSFNRPDSAIRHNY